MASQSNSPPPPADPTTKPSTFRFKRKHPASPSLSAHNTPSSKHHRSNSPLIPSPPHHHHRHHRRHRSHHRSPVPHLDPDTAFRESLFDALADDEGAAFWESVYGQPIHTYSPYKPSSSTAPSTPQDAEQETLQRMSDEEYTAYVRAKMWEKSHEYVVEERRRREAERTRRKRRDEEAKEWQRGVEEALRRGEERRRKGRWRGLWEAYLREWERFAAHGSAGQGNKEQGKDMKVTIPWPVESGTLEDVWTEQVERFFRHAPVESLGDVLKRERVRWHPDKVVQRAGGAGVDEETMRGVTAVFQVVDRMWAETRSGGRGDG